MDKKSCRFRLARGLDGKWVTIDIFTGLPVGIDQNLIKKMDRAGFDDVVEFLNNAKPVILHVDPTGERPHSPTRC
jgi:hypothetical protein